MFIRILPTTLLQIFCGNLLYFQIIFKSMKIADDTFLGNSECEWVKVCCVFLHYCELVFKGFMYPYYTFLSKVALIMNGLIYVRLWKNAKFQKYVNKQSNPFSLP